MCGDDGIALMVDHDFSKCAPISVQLKGMNNALDAAAEMGFHAPITQLFASLHASGVEHGLAEKNYSALFLELARRNGK